MRGWLIYRFNRLFYDIYDYLYEFMYFHQVNKEMLQNIRPFLQKSETE